LNIDDLQDPDEAIQNAKVDQSAGNVEVVAFSVSLQLELNSMNEKEREEFCGEMGVMQYDRDQLIQKIMATSGQMLFFTAGEKEVRTWMIPKGATAVDAAGSIHTDLANGFVRAETMTCVDLFRLGSERETKAHNLMRKEHKEYVIQDGDILYILATA
jgi:ribosome-binding ATPase YchF (GTP1/OBG family)